MAKQATNLFTGLSKQRRTLLLACIKDFFFKALPKFREYSQDKKFIKTYGNFNSLGVEGALEACIALFKEGELQIRAKSVEDYVIYAVWDGELHLIHDSTK